jgi:L-fuconate dehydratase
VRRLCREAIAAGWTHFKLKVGGEPADDLRRAMLLREEIGWQNKLMVDANQKWSVDEAIGRTRMLSPAAPWWMEEPTSPDDILGHARIRREVKPLRIATGEHCHNRVMFKQLFQVEAIDVCQIDATRVAGVNEILAILLMAAKFNVPVCPHAGGVGLCEYVQHLSFFDFLRVSCSIEDRVIEYVDHLHEHFLDPVHIVRGGYQLPTRPGYSIEMKSESLTAHNFESGSIWKELA